MNGEELRRWAEKLEVPLDELEGAKQDLAMMGVVEATPQTVLLVWLVRQVVQIRRTLDPAHIGKAVGRFLSGLRG